MEDQRWLAERFEEHRARLRAVAHRMLGSTSEALSAVPHAAPSRWYARASRRPTRFEPGHPARLACREPGAPQAIAVAPAAPPSRRQLGENYGA